jgi:site-specific DNA recombinase
MGMPAVTPPMSTGPAEPVPVAFIGRTSTLVLQDPAASLRRQARECQAKLPQGWYIAAWFWDIESGGLPTEARGHGDAHEQFTGIGLPRDGGLADLLTEAASPVPRFASVICEDIERSGRDTYYALQLEKQLTLAGIPLFATDEPIDVAGANATTVLVRRVKQGVAEWFRLQIKEKAWRGLREHSLAGWNIGTPPHGYAAERVQHPVPFKAAQGRTKTRLILDPERSPPSPLSSPGGCKTGSARTPSPSGWPPTRTATPRPPKPGCGPRPLSTRSCATPSTPVTWCSAAPAASPAGGQFRSPKTSGYGPPSRRTPRSSPGRCGTQRRPLALSTPPAATAPASTPTARPAAPTSCARGYGAAPANGACPGSPRTSRRYWAKGPDYESTYYTCSHNPDDPRRTAPEGHPRTISVREDHLLPAIHQFFAQRVFGPDRVTLFAADLPASAADDQARRDRQAAALHKRLRKIDAAENAHAREIESLAHLDDPHAPAVTALRSRVLARFTELEDERAGINTQLADLAKTDPGPGDPALLDALPMLGDRLTHAPTRLQQQLYEAFDLQALYKKNMHQVTIQVTITDSTPRAVAAIISDASNDPGSTAPEPGEQPSFSDLAQAL